MESLSPDVGTQLSQDPAQARHTKQALVGVTIILLAAVVTFLCIYPPSGKFIEGTISAVMLPNELSTARFAPARFATAPAAVYTKNGSNYIRNFYDGHIISVAAGIPEVVVTEGSDGLYRVFVSSVSVLASERALLGAALSPNQRAVAVTRQSSGAPGSLSARDYEVVIVFPGNGKEISMGNGFAPVFVDDGTLLWITPLGVHSRNIATGETKLLVKHTFAHVVSSVTYSPDKSLVAWSELSGSTTDVYRIQTGEKVASFAAVLPLIALSNTGLFALNPQEWRTTVTYYSLDGSHSQMVHSLPGSYQIRKLAL